MAPHPAAMQVQQGGGYFMQHQQAHAQVQAQAQAQQQAGLFPSKMPLQFGAGPHQPQLHDPQQQLHQQAMSGRMQMGMLGPNNRLLHHPVQHPETTGPTPGNKQDAQGSDVRPAAGSDGQGTLRRAEGSKEAK